MNLLDPIVIGLLIGVALFALLAFGYGEFRHCRDRAADEKANRTQFFYDRDGWKE